MTQELDSPNGRRGRAGAFVISGSLRAFDRASIFIPIDIVESSQVKNHYFERIVWNSVDKMSGKVKKNVDLGK